MSSCYSHSMCVPAVNTLMRYEKKVAVDATRRSEAKKISQSRMKESLNA